MKRVLITADDALKSAAEAGKGRSEEADKKFREAIDLLSRFEKDFPSKNSTSNPNISGAFTMEAKMNDKFGSPSTILSALKKDLYSEVNLLFTSLL